MAYFSSNLPVSCDSNHEIFAIGDVHGCLENLVEVLSMISKTPRVVGRARIVVFLGDIIDRGPHSLACIDMARDARAMTRADEVVYLMGNHEQMLAVAIGPRTLGEKDSRTREDDHRQFAMRAWLNNGGAKMMRDYPYSSIEEVLGAERHDWLLSTKSHFVSGSLLFVHAGLPPDVEVANLDEISFDVDFNPDGYFRESTHWAWVRDPFLGGESSGGHDGYFVVHGHTVPMYELFPSPKDQVDRWRVNLDGGSFMTRKVRYARIVDDSLVVHEI